jgi:hypothetical protein
VGLLITTADPVSIGRQPWGRIKTNGKMMREDWRLVGEALLVGRRKFTTADGGLYKKGFGQWCRESGFGDIDQRVRTDAMWLAQEWEATQQLLVGRPGLCYPPNIRELYRELTADTAEPVIPPALPDPKSSAPLEQTKTSEPVENKDDILSWDNLQ